MIDINEGDKVVIVETSGYETYAILVHKPSGCGDLWGFKNFFTGKEFYLNPYASTFETLEKVYEDG